MKRVRFIAALVAVALMLTVAGCSEWRTTSDSNSDGAGDTDVAFTEDLPEETKEDVTSVSEETEEAVTVIREEYIDPIGGYHRVGTEGTMKVTLLGYESLRDAVDYADVIVDITVTEWLGELNAIPFGRGEKTFFKARVNNVIGGELSDNSGFIVFQQEGDSKYTIHNYPLFKIGDRMVVFLKVATSYEEGNENDRVELQEIGISSDDAVYWIAGDFDVTFHVQEREGRAYLLAYAGDIIGSAAYCGEIELEEIHEGTKNVLVSVFNENDLVMSSLRLLKKAYVYDEVVGILSDFAADRSVG